MLFVTFYFCYLEVLKKIKVQFKLKIPYVPAKNYMFYSRARVGVGAGKKYGSIKKPPAPATLDYPQKLNYRKFLDILCVHHQASRIDFAISLAESNYFLVQ